MTELPHNPSLTFLHQLISTSMLGQERHISIKTWNEGAMVDASLEFQIQVKNILTNMGSM